MNIYQGIGVSDGVAIGKVLKINSAYVNYPRIQLKSADEVPIEIKRIKQAQKLVEEQLESIIDQSLDVLPEEISSVFLSYKMFIRDKKFVPAIEKKIEEVQINAEWALIHVIADLERQFAKLADPYIRARFDDVRQLGERLMNQLLEKPHLDLSQLKDPVVIVCHDISPADSFHLTKAKILGIVTELGGTTSHSSILARAMNIPAVVGVQDITIRLLDDEQIILDGNLGEVICDPSEEIIKAKLNKKERFKFFQYELEKLTDFECVLSDGKKVDLAANLDFMSELSLIKSLNISSIGLIRTEFLFLIEDSFPDEEQQFALYEQIILENQKKPITIRTWDVGGDKPTKMFPELAEEANPALGLRAIRIFLKYQDIFRTQLRAIIRASQLGEIKVMIPMVTRIDEVLKTKRIIAEEQKNLGISSENLQIGVMIETPASAFIIDDFLDLIDFISIGSNDLIQYALAVDRMNEHVADLFAPFHPAILKMLEKIVNSANRMDKPVSICGELAADPIFQMFLLGVGKVTFSMSPNHILHTKSVLRKVDTATCKKIAFQFMNKHSFEENNQYVETLRNLYMDRIDD
ncbi:phosphoenolpyruvate--protein phosphotransferase [bacterium]|nr:phosphoenolpyruvate--protein phosphotransferase [bacterium]